MEGLFLYLHCYQFLLWRLNNLCRNCKVYERLANLYDCPHFDIQSIYITDNSYQILWRKSVIWTFANSFLTVSYPGGHCRTLTLYCMYWLNFVKVDMFSICWLENYKYTNKICFAAVRGAVDLVWEDPLQPGDGLHEGGLTECLRHVTIPPPAPASPGLCHSALIVMESLEDVTSLKQAKRSRDATHDVWMKIFVKIVQHLSPDIPL